MKIEVCNGSVGIALYVDDVRVAGPGHNGLMTTLLSASVAPNAATEVSEAKHRPTSKGYVAGYKDARADALQELRIAVRDIKAGSETIQRLSVLEDDIRAKALPEKAGKP